MAPLKPQKKEQTGSFRLQVTAPAMQEERNKRTPAVPMTQEPYQQIYKKKKKTTLFKNFTQMCSLCTKYKRILFLVPTFLERCFSLGPLPGLRLSAAPRLPLGSSFRGRGLLRPQSVLQLRRGPIPSSPSQQSGPTSAFTPPSSRLHRRTVSRWCCLLLQVFSRRGDQTYKLWTSFPLPRILPH